MTSLSDLIEEAAKRYGLSNRSDYLRRTMHIESKGDPEAYNKGSGATGLFQFIPSTGKAYAPGKDLTDPVINIDAAARLTRDNAETLRKALGREPTDAELYLAHNQGATGAARMLTDASQRVGDTVGDAAVQSNFKGDPNMTNSAYAARVMAAFNDTKPGASAGTPTGEDTSAQLPQLQAASDEAEKKQKAASDALAKLMAKPKVNGANLSSGGAILQGLSDAWDQKRAQQPASPPPPPPPAGPGNMGMGGTAQTGAQTDAAMGNANQGDWMVPGTEPVDPIKALTSKLATMLGV